jgi:hypothetical protein
LTRCTNAADELAARFAFPEYAAVSECDPVVSTETASCAALPATAEVPSTVVPSINVTVPVAATPLGGKTDAVRTTACPNVDGFELDEIPVVVAAGVTDSLSAVDVLAAKLASPL